MTKNLNNKANKLESGGIDDEREFRGTISLVVVRAVIAFEQSAMMMMMMMMMGSPWLPWFFDVMMV